MQEIQVTIQNEDGLHARPAGMLAKKAGEYTSAIEVKAKGMSKNAKSIMGVMSLGLEKGDVVTFVVTGADEEKAIEALAALASRGFSA